MDSVLAKRLKIIGGVVVTVALLVAGILSIDDTPKDIAQGNDITSTNVREFDPAFDNYYGDPESYKVTLIEYSDFQCPACRSFYPIVDTLKEEFGDDLLFVYRHFPLVGIHANAKPAAQASEAAGLQGKFFEYHDLLFDGQDDWKDEKNPESIFVSYAEQLGLDVEKFIEDMNGSEIKKKVNDSLAESLGMGLRGTPTFFVNGKMISNPGSYEEFKAIIQAEIDRG